MPEWAILLVGVAGGVIAALAGAGFTAWLQERRERRRRGAELIARLRVLLMDADPKGVLFSVASDPERATRNGRDLWRRWWELREPFYTFAINSRPAIQQAAKEAATHAALSIQATRNAIDATSEPDRSEAKRIAEQQYQFADECLDELDRTFAAHRWSA